MCTYVGKLYTSEEGNQLGRIFGDEYYADLDLIEIVERGKVRGINRSKISLIENNAKIRFLKRLTCKGTSLHCFNLSEAPSPPMTPYSPLLQTVYVYTVYFFTQGGGGGANQREG